MSPGNKARIAKAIVAFAKANSMVIHPAIGYGYFVENLVLLGACACAPERKSCPCPESKREVLEDGKCKCGLYWKDLDAFIAWDPTNPGKKITQGASGGNQDRESDRNM